MLKVRSTAIIFSLFFSSNFSNFENQEIKQVPALQREIEYNFSSHKEEIEYIKRKKACEKEDAILQGITVTTFVGIALGANPYMAIPVFLANCIYVIL